MAPLTQARRSQFKSALAKRLRANPSDAERRLWSLLRGGQLGVRFRRQQPIGPYIADFFCSRARLVVELDGDQHGSDAGQARDTARTNWLDAQGYRVLRFPNGQVLTDANTVRDVILHMISERLVPLPEMPTAFRPSLKGRVE